MKNRINVGRSGSGAMDAVESPLDEPQADRNTVAASSNILAVIFHLMPTALSSQGDLLRPQMDSRFPHVMVLSGKSLNKVHYARFIEFVERVNSPPGSEGDATLHDWIRSQDHVIRVAAHDYGQLIR